MNPRDTVRTIATGDSKTIDITLALALLLRATEGPTADVITIAIKEIEHLRARLHTQQDRVHELEALIIAAADITEDNTGD